MDIKPQPSHLPLVFMLVLTQLSVGAFLLQQVLGMFAVELTETNQQIFSLCALGMGIAGLGAAILHLGRPLYAFRAVIGFRKSWLSREIVAFSLFALLASAYVAASWIPADVLAVSSEMKALLSVSTSFAGLLGVFCSAMIYIDTRREFWNARYTFTKFFLTTLLLGTAAAIPLATAYRLPLAIILVGLSTAKFILELSLFKHLKHTSATQLKKSALLLLGQLRPVMELRVLLGFAGGLALPTIIALSQGTDNFAFTNWIAGGVLITCLAGELLERYLYFTAVVPLKMPGNLDS